MFQLSQAVLYFHFPYQIKYLLLFVKKIPGARSMLSFIFVQKINKKKHTFIHTYVYMCACVYVPMSVSINY